MSAEVITIGKLAVEIEEDTWCSWCENDNKTVIGGIWNSICLDCAEEIVNAFRFPNASVNVFEENAAETPQDPA